MDLFVLEQTPSGSAIILEHGHMINGLDSKMWIERYRNAGEFTLVGNVGNGYRDILPIGSFISHTGTDELMIVENHEIDEGEDADVKIKITGRSIEAPIMENRIVGANRASVSPVGPYATASGTAWDAAALLIDAHVRLCTPLNTGDAISNCRVVSTVTGVPIVNTVRELELKQVYQVVLELLAQNDIGIKSVRPGPWTLDYDQPGPSGAFFVRTDFGFVIHNGVDRRREVGLSYNEGDIKSGQYLWTNKSRKDSVQVNSKWYSIRVDSGPTGISRRVGTLDARDIDENFASAPAGADITRIQAAMTARGNEYLGKQNDINISRIEITDNNSRYSYRWDYNVGDIVAVNGNYETNTVMRVAEFVEIEDENGYIGYPTLEAIA